MVMEAPPSPQSVGREFVRQYYTLMHQAPNHLHRFYNNQSSFVHGGLDPSNREPTPVIGQKAIHLKIQQLNFRDCHAKITQVDSQATLGGGVVVQVTGELSNAGQPMRRFTQTFVLAAQAPKKYYVHNDIFRYQDEIISDEECEAETCSEPEEEANQECPVISEVPQQQPPQVIPFFNANAPLQPGMQPVPHIPAQPPQHVMPPQPVAQVNGALHPEEINIISAQAQIPSPVMSAPQNIPPAQIPVMHSNIVVPSSSPPAVMEEALVEQVEEPRPAFVEAVEPEPEQQDFSVDQASPSNEPKTYANLLKSTTYPPAATVQTSPPQPQPAQQQQPQQQQILQQQQQPPQAPVTPNQSYQPKPVSPTFNQPGRNMNRNNRNGPQNARMPRQDSNRMSGGRNDEGGDDRRKSQSGSYSDSNQLFLGNLPHNATEDELREVFTDFGIIVDLRVHGRGPNKNGMAGGRIPPNYGFITFETIQGVQNCLAARPIYFPKGKEGATPLNVEEKKTKDRPSYGGRPNNDNRNRDRDNNAPRRGPSGPNRNGTNGNGNPGTQQNRPAYNNRNGPTNRGPNNGNNNNNTTYNNRR
ncbi:ras GTPase-activating protein-binding protein 2 isoform X2 [Coccinella septempunctata]|nr:ras GTPase-activating protein-binding protein 2 isoform X2 [Coccinella septempunctata]